MLYSAGVNAKANAGVTTVDCTELLGKVTFTASPAATLTPSTTTLDSSGKASVVVSAAPSNATVNVTASIAGLIGTKTIQFIQQPDKVVVHVAITKTLTDLAILSFGLENSMGANCTYTSKTAAPGYTGFTDSNTSFLSPVGSNLYTWFIYVFGLNTTTSANLLELTFTPAAAGIPYFDIFIPASTASNLSYSKYTRITNDPTTDTISAVTNLATTDFVIVTDYYLGATLLATK